MYCGPNETGKCSTQGEVESDRSLALQPAQHHEPKNVPMVDNMLPDAFRLRSEQVSALLVGRDVSTKKWLKS
jgi:hypothetical protein